MRILLIYIIHTESKRKVCDIKKDVSTCVCDTEREREDEGRSNVNREILVCDMKTKIDFEGRKSSY